MSRYSVVIIARNEEKYIKKSVMSILGQSVKPYRVVVVDDGSIDATPDILNTLNVTVKRIPHQERGLDVYSNTLAEIRNVGFACIRDDPVDWIYSGDADIALPSRYCARLMEQAEEHNATISSGISHAKLELPHDAYRMIRHAWLKSVGMKTRWESVFLCLMALSQNRTTLVSYHPDCIVAPLKPSHGYLPKRHENKGRLARWMGMTLPMFCLWSLIVARRNGLRNGYRYFKGGLGAKRQVPQKMAKLYNIKHIDHILSAYNPFGTLGNSYSTVDRHYTHTICHPPLCMDLGG